MVTHNENVYYCVSSVQRPKSNDDIEKCVKCAVNDLYTVISGEVAHVSYEQMYRNQYNAVVNGNGQRIYDAIVDILRKMSLFTLPRLSNKTLRLICQVSVFLCRNWVTVNNQIDLDTYGKWVYMRPVARRWRRAVAMVRWKLRIMAWRCTFNELAFRPEGVSALRVGAHFYECAQSVKTSP